MHGHAPGLIRPPGVVGGLPAARLPFRGIDVDPEVAQEAHGVCACLSVKLITETCGKQRDSHPLGIAEGWVGLREALIDDVVLAILAADLEVEPIVKRG